MSEKTLDEIRSSGLDRGSAPSSWASDASKLSAALFKSFAETGRDRVIFSNFARWASGDMPSGRRGVNFENMYYDASSYPDEGGKMQRNRRAKSPARNCYAFAPVRIDYMVPDLDVVRMERILSVTFAGADGAPQTILSYMSLVACSVRLPEVTIALVGSGGKGGTLFLSGLMRDVWGYWVFPTPRLLPSKLPRSSEDKGISTAASGGYL